MAIYKIFPTKDATIYTEIPEMNTGLDAILECSTYVANNNPQTSRFLIAFSQQEISNILTNYISSSLWDVNLKLFQANITGLNKETSIHAFPVAADWSMGTGRYLDSPINPNGVNWNTSQNTINWPTNNFEPYVTASFTEDQPGGGCWYTGSSENMSLEVSQSFSYYSNTDLDLDVSNIIYNWYLENIPNYGFILKQSDNFEFSYNTNTHAQIKYFSRDTNTIYPPYLEFKWDDFVYQTGSHQTLDSPEAFVNIYNNQGIYFNDSIEKFRISAVPKYPQRQFTTSSVYTKNYYLPENSWYAIKDTQTNNFIIDFDEVYTKISADNEGSYFILYMNGLEPERYYTILIKTKIGNTIRVYDHKLSFKITNG